MIDSILSTMFPERLSKQDRVTLDALKKALSTHAELLEDLNAKRNPTGCASTARLRLKLGASRLQPPHLGF